MNMSSPNASKPFADARIARAVQEHRQRVTLAAEKALREVPLDEASMREFNEYVQFQIDTGRLWYEDRTLATRRIQEYNQNTYVRLSPAAQKAIGKLGQELQGPNLVGTVVSAFWDNDGGSKGFFESFKLPEIIAAVPAGYYMYQMIKAQSGSAILGSLAAAAFSYSVAWGVGKAKDYMGLSGPGKMPHYPPPAGGASPSLQAGLGQQQQPGQPAPVQTSLQSALDAAQAALGNPAVRQLLGQPATGQPVPGNVPPASNPPGSSPRPGI